MNLLQKYFSIIRNLTEESEEHPMIEHNGKMVHRNNSDGEPIHHTDEGIKAFHDWFGNSKVVDEHKRPLVVYHGTSHDIHTFDEKKPGHYFTPDIYYGHIKNAHMLPKMHGHEDGAGNVMPTYLKIHHPLYSETPSQIEGVGYNQEWADEIKKDGYDGIIHAKKNNIHKGPSGWGDDRVQMFVLHPSQIKSALGNNGKYSKTSNNITEWVNS